MTHQFSIDNKILSNIQCQEKKNVITYLKNVCHDYNDKTYRIGWLGFLVFHPASHGQVWLNVYLFHTCVMINRVINAVNSPIPTYPGQNIRNEVILQVMT